ncbi:MAG: hypothetical protein LRZ88_10645, partial [Candidatus Cloacimonetes bacterium]|nr:hypothetical protein [Candidatus Cloacimonadota bacterium]
LVDIVRYSFEDDLFRSIWSASEAGWDLVLYNKSGNPIMIDWNNARYMDVDNIGHTVLISGTRLSERDKDQTPSLIPRNGNVTEKLFSQPTSTNHRLPGCGQSVHFCP